MTAERKELANRSADHVAAAARAVFSMVPGVGPVLTELVGVVIPNQRADRLAKFAAALDRRLSTLELDRAKERLADEVLTDLLEDGLWQAARSISDERREYIASLIANGLKAQDIEHSESKHLLRILGELNDIEVIWLRAYYDWDPVESKAFREKHKDVLEPASAHSESTPAELDKAALQDSYKAHLISLNLLHQEMEVQSKFGSANLKEGRRRLTPLGRLLLREIGLIPRER